ncbi:MAG: Tim44 domain-containing protein [Rhodospirillales bacterium]|nr:Tim44 domain-containing protein [Rhodospirillales bacterium]
MPADILLYALVAAGLVFWLRNVLGTRTGEERQRPNPFTGTPASDKDTGKSDQPGQASALLPEDGESWGKGLERNMSVSESAHVGLMDIARADRSFDVLFFLRGAQDAFVMIVEAFAAGDKATLKNLLSEPVYQAFEGVINTRAETGETAETEIHSVRKIEVIEAALNNKAASITIRFVADETNILRDKDGVVISGNPERVTETIDIWTFSRDIKSRNPAWLLTATRDEDADSHDHKTVPDSIDA